MKDTIEMLQNIFDSISEIPPIEKLNFLRGIYLLIDKSEIVYVGMTTKGLTRVLHHLDKDFDSYKIVPLEDFPDEIIKDVEVALIATFQPKYNSQNLPAPIRKYFHAMAFLNHHLKK